MENCVPEPSRVTADSSADELTRLREYAHAATKAITGLTPGGGSECFAGKIGDLYVADLPFCVWRIQERDATKHRLAVDAIRERMAADRRAKSAEDALAYLLGEAEFAVKYVPEAAETLRARMHDAIGVAQSVLFRSEQATPACSSAAPSNAQEDGA